MHTLSALATVLATLHLASAATTCNSNDCLRQVRATAFPSRTQDCSSFLVYTSTPVTITTVTRTATRGLNSKRDALPQSSSFSSSAPPRVPAYASSCSDAQAYASACQCIGVSYRGVTASSTITSTVTTTTFVSPSVSPTPFYITANIRNGTSPAVSYIAYVNRGDLLMDRRSAVANPPAFLIDPSNDQVVPAADSGPNGPAFFYYAPEGATSYPIFVVSKIENWYPSLRCRIQGSRFICKYRDADGVFVLCRGGDLNGRVAIARDANSFADTCASGTVIQLTAVPA